MSSWVTEEPHFVPSMHMGWGEPNQCSLVALGRSLCNFTLSGNKRFSSERSEAVQQWDAGKDGSSGHFDVVPLRSNRDQSDIEVRKKEPFVSIWIRCCSASVLNVM